MAETTVVLGVTLNCPEVALCDALKEAVREIRRGDLPLEVRLVVEDRSDRHLAAHLEWRSPGGDLYQRGPAVTLKVMDSTVRARNYARYLRSLLKLSQIPL